MTKPRSNSLPMMPVSYSSVSSSAMEAGDLVVNGVVTPGAVTGDSATKRRLVTSASHASFVTYGSSNCSSPSMAMLLSTPPGSNTPRLISSKDNTPTRQNKLQQPALVSITEATSLVAAAPRRGGTSDKKYILFDADAKEEVEEDVKVGQSSAMPGIKDGTLAQQVRTPSNLLDLSILTVLFI